MRRRGLCSQLLRTRESSPGPPSDYWAESDEGWPGLCLNLESGAAILQLVGLWPCLSSCRKSGTNNRCAWHLKAGQQQLAHLHMCIRPVPAANCVDRYPKVLGSRCSAASVQPHTLTENMWGRLWLALPSCTCRFNLQVAHLLQRGRHQGRQPRHIRSLADHGDCHSRLIVLEVVESSSSVHEGNCDLARTYSIA